MSIGQAFNQSVSYYDEWVRKAIPCFGEIFGTAVEVIPYPDNAPITVLDLGAGTGLFSEMVQRRYANARFELVDLAADMLDVAKTRFGADEQFAYTVSDYRTLVSESEFELVISSLSIHHLTHAEKRDLFGRIYTALKPGGVFINLDQIKAPTEAGQRLYWDMWLQKVRAAGATEAQIEKSIQRRTTFDKDALLVDQLAWLNEAGFATVDCIYKHYFVGVFLATKE